MNRYLLEVKLENSNYCTSCPVSYYIPVARFNNSGGIHVCTVLCRDITKDNFKRPTDCPLRIKARCGLCKSNGKTIKTSCRISQGDDWHCADFEPKEGEK